MEWIWYKKLIAAGEIQLSSTTTYCQNKIIEILELRVSCK